MTKRLFLILGLLALLSLGLIGCGTDRNPMTSGDAEPTEPPPPPPPPAPKSLSVNEISLDGFPNTKDDGSTWDWDPFNSDSRRPDPMVVVTYSSGTLLETDYISNTTSSPGIAWILDFDNPKTFAMNTVYTITVYDHDAVGRQKMGSITFRAQGYYDANPTQSEAYMRIKGNGISVIFRGTWNR